MASDGLEHYRSFYTNYRHPYGVSGRISKEDTEKLNTYLVVRRDKENRITSIQKLYNNGKKCQFYMEYNYTNTGELYSFESIETCEPYVFIGENTSAPELDNGEENNENIEYYTSVQINTFPYNVSGRIKKEDAENLKEFAIVKRDKKNRIIVLEKISQKRRFFIFKRYKRRLFRIEYTYKEDGELYYYKWIFL